MTPEEMQKSGEKKVQAIQSLCTSLKIDMQAKQKISSDGVIETMVMYVDMENYPTEENIKEDSLALNKKINDKQPKIEDEKQNSTSEEDKPELPKKS